MELQQDLRELLALFKENNNADEIVKKSNPVPAHTLKRIPRLGLIPLQIIPSVKCRLPLPAQGKGIYMDRIISIFSGFVTYLARDDSRTASVNRAIIRNE